MARTLTIRCAVDRSNRSVPTASLARALAVHRIAGIQNSAAVRSLRVGNRNSRFPPRTRLVVSLGELLARARSSAVARHHVASSPSVGA
jgi:hypothetical protein